MTMVGLGTWIRFGTAIKDMLRPLLPRGNSPKTLAAHNVPVPDARCTKWMRQGSSGSIGGLDAIAQM